MSRLKKQIPTSNGISLVVEGFHAAIECGSKDKSLPAFIQQLWKAGSQCIDEQGHGFIPKDKNKPQPDSQGPRLAAIAPLVESQNPNSKACDLARKILAAHADPAQLHHVGDLHHSIAEVSITSWLIAHWRLQEMAG